MNKKLSLLEAVELTVKVWEHIRDNRLVNKNEIDDPDLNIIFDMDCTCPLCEYSHQKEMSNGNSFDVYYFCTSKCPLKNCLNGPYWAFCNSETEEERIMNANLIIKQLRRYASRVLKKKLIV